MAEGGRQHRDLLIHTSNLNFGMASSGLGTHAHPMSPVTSSNYHHHHREQPRHDATLSTPAEDIAIVEQLLLQTQRMHSSQPISSQLSGIYSAAGNHHVTPGHAHRTQSVIKAELKREKSEEIDIGGNNRLVVDERAKTPPALAGLDAFGGGKFERHAPRSCHISDYARALKKKHRAKPYKLTLTPCPVSSAIEVAGNLNEDEDEEEEEGEEEDGFEGSEQSSSSRSFHQPRHQLTVRGEGNRCHFCPKRFDTLHLLNEHINFCVSSRPHECSQCGKRFKTRAGLDQHNRIHIQHRPYACHFCGKTFIQKCHVDQHERIHTGVKPYVCNFCGRAFRQKSGQQQHEMTHLK